MNLDPIWTSFLDFLAQIIVPAWNNLIQYIPLLLTLLLIVSIAALTWSWQRNSAANRPRVPRPLPAGRKPEDMHLPGPSLWPFVDLGLTPFKGDGGLKAVTVNAGMWNAFNTQISKDDGFTNLDGELTGNKWYEADYYATLGLGFGGGVSFSTTYTSYTSPANLFNHVKELAMKVAIDDSGALGKASLKPYGMIAFELTDDGQVVWSTDGEGSATARRFFDEVWS